MLFAPRKSKYRKAFKGRNVGNATSGDNLAFANYGIKIEQNMNLKSTTFEAAYRVVSKDIKASNSKLWVRPFAHKPVSKKPIEVRMGKGKGPVDHHVATIRAGNLIFEFDGNNLEDMKKIASKCSIKIGRKCRLISREVGGVFIDGDVYGS